MDVAETRFTHLLQPIRDLTKNWEVDVASQLGEYLDELDQICISFDEGNTTMNFAEAALLIQGSACIYSKKVEYLYSLVYQALDFISNKNRRDKQPTSIEPDGRDKDATFGHKKDKVEFLSLDDFSETNSANVELRNDNAKGLEIVPLTPEPLIPVEVEEKKKNPLLSHKGEVLASCRDFRMNTFTPRANGLIRLDLISTPSMFVKDIRLYMQDNLVASPIVGLEDANPQNTPLPPLNLSEGPDEGGVMPGAAGAGDLPEAFLPLEGDEGMELDPGTDEHICRQQAPSERRMLRERPAERAGLQPEDIPDPWRCHNPFSTPLPDKPLKIGKHFTIPPGVQEVTGNKRKRRGTVKLPAFMDWFTKTSSDRPSRRTKKGPTFPDMEDLYWNNVREKLKILKRFQRRAGVLVCDVPGQRNLDQWGSEEQQQDEGLDEQPDDFQDPDGGGGDFSDHENPAEIADDRDLVITASQTERMSYEDLVKRSVELFLVNSRKYEQETVLSRRMKDWEEMIGPQLSTQEGQLAFDIHDYGNKIMAAFSDVAERRTFASIVRGKESHEVCRYMLASLQLANDHTVEIHRGEGLEEAIDTMALTLLTNQKAHERFKTYTAPSVTNAS